MATRRAKVHRIEDNSMDHLAAHLPGQQVSGAFMTSSTRTG